MVRVVSPPIPAQRGASLTAISSRLCVFLFCRFAPSTYGKAPTGRAGHSSTFIDGRVVIFGGCAGRKWLNEVFTLDLNRWHWAKIETMGESPTFRSYHTATAMDICGAPHIVVFGGNNGHRTFDSVHTLNVRTWAWETRECVCAEGEEIVARTGHAATRLDAHRILITCGWDYSDAQAEPKRFDDAYVLDTRDWRWQRLYPTNSIGSRVGHSALLLQTYGGDHGAPGYAMSSSSGAESSSSSSSSSLSASSVVADVWLFGGQTADEELLSSSHILSLPL